MSHLTRTILLALAAFIAIPVIAQGQRRVRTRTPKKPTTVTPKLPIKPSTTTEVEKSDKQVAQLIAQSEARFKEGELHLKAGTRSLARIKFDAALDVILKSGMDVRGSQKLQAYYLELVERIYRLEVPLQQVAPRVTLAQAQTMPP